MHYDLQHGLTDIISIQIKLNLGEWLAFLTKESVK